MDNPVLAYAELLPRGEDATPFRLLTREGIRTVEAAGRTFLEVEPEALRLLTETAMHDIAHFLRPAHLAQLRRIIDDPEASPNDRFVALDAADGRGEPLRSVQHSEGAVGAGQQHQHARAVEPWLQLNRAKETEHDDRERERADRPE